MSTKHQKLQQTFDFIDFQDNLQPLIDSLTVSALAVNLKAQEHDDQELTAIAVSVITIIKQIKELCNQFHELKKGKG
jgi:RNAse (barnase) inhibitor barstar